MWWFWNSRLQNNGRWAAAAPILQGPPQPHPTARPSGRGGGGEAPSYSAVVVQPAPGTPKAVAPPAHPEVATLASLAARSIAVQARQPYVGVQAKELQQAGIQQLVLGKAPQDWPVDQYAAELAKVVIVGAKLRDAHERAETALELHDSVAEVCAIVLSKGG